MANNFQSIISFYVETICTLMMSEPFIYFTGALLSLFILKILRELTHITR